MRKFLLASVMTGLLVASLPAAPAHAADQPANVSFVFSVTGTVPCAVACSYWQAAGSLGYRPCENPFPGNPDDPTGGLAGSVRDATTQPAPTPPAGKKMILDLYTTPEVDWDTWICTLLSTGSHNGGELAQGANILGELCDNFLGPDNPVPVGCIEEAQAPAEAGKRYVLRAYNWSDYRDDPAIYKWIFV